MAYPNIDLVAEKAYKSGQKNERYKIDKAIAEIENYTVEDNCEDGVMFALETLKRCLKEKRR